MALTAAQRQATIDAIAGQFYAQLGDDPLGSGRELLLQRQFGVIKAAADATAATVTAETPFFEAEEDCVITRVSFLPAAAVTAHATNYFTLLVDKRDGAGGSATNIATFAADTVTTDDLTAFVPKDLTLSATATDLVLSAGNVLTYEITKAASGLICPAGVWLITYYEW